MSKKNKMDELVEFTGEAYADETLKIVQNNVKLSTKLAAILCMFESYYNVFVQNQKELINIVDKATSEKAKEENDTAHLKRIKQTSKNKLTRVNNQSARFDKFNKEFSGEFTKYFGDKAGEMSESVLDAFDLFWENIVRVTDESVSIKEDPERIDLIGQNGNTGEHYCKTN